MALIFRCALRRKGGTGYQALVGRKDKRLEEEEDEDEDEAAADAEGYGFGVGGGGAFAEDGGYVGLGGVVGDVETGAFGVRRSSESLWYSGMGPSTFFSARVGKI